MNNLHGCLDVCDDGNGLEFESFQFQNFKERILLFLELSTDCIVTES